MKNLNYQTLTELNYEGYLLKDAPERMLQFGEGNFLRAFVDYFVDEMNEKANFNTKVVLCQPIAHGLTDMINEQEGLYTLFLRGREDGKKVNHKKIISSVSRCIDPYLHFDQLLETARNEELRFISCNTTEAGIVYDDQCKFNDTPPSSFPAKLTRLLYERFSSFNSPKGFIILSCELIDNNGKELEKCVLQYAQLWNLSEDFIQWIKKENIFCSTLVDRIVTGYPRNEAEELCNELGYKDNLINTAETFGFWVIEGPASLAKELPFKEAGLPVIITDDHTPYKQRKVRILNGAHTSMVLGAYLAGKDIVRDCMNDDVICQFMNQTIYQEIIPTLTLPKKELDDFAASVTDRFNNPFIDHSLLAISLNSTSKWKARVLPSLKEYVNLHHMLPQCITASFAFYIVFYRGLAMKDGALIGKRNHNEYEIVDDPNILDFFYQHIDSTIEKLVHDVCSNKDFFGEDLTKIDGFYNQVLSYTLQAINNGTYEVMKTCISTNNN